MSRFTTVDLDAFVTRGRGEGICPLGDVADALVFPRDLDPHFAAIEIPDPLGVADEYAARLMEAWTDLDILIESLQTGRNPITIRGQRRLIAAGAATPKQPTESERQLAAQFTIATLSYQAGFANDGLIERYGQHMNRERIEVLLAVEERKKIRKRIGTARDNLVAYLNSDEYQDPELWADYLDNTPDRLVEGKARVLSHLQPLVLRPGDKDRHLTLPADRPRAADPDPGHVYMRDVLEASNIAGRVWAKPADLDRVDDVDIQFVYAVLAEFAQTYAHRPDADEPYLQLVAERMSTITQGARLPRWQVVPTRIAAAEPNDYEPLPHQPEGVITLVQPSAAATVAKGAEGGTRLIEQALEDSATYTGSIRVQPTRDDALGAVPAIAAVVHGRTLDIGAFARQIRDTREYARGMGGVLAGLATLNAVFAVKRAAKGGDSIGRTLFDLTSAVAGVGSAYYELRHLVDRSRGLNLKWLEFLKGRTLIYAAPAALFGGVTSGIDAWGNAAAGDVDAAAYQTIAAGFGMAEGAVLAHAAWAGLAGPSGWLAVGLLAGFFGFSLLGALSEDDPLEVFAKNGPMAKRLRSTPPGAPLRFEKRYTGGTSVPVPVHAPDVPQGFMPYKQARWQSEHTVYSTRTYPQWDAQAPLEDAVRELVAILHGYRLEDRVAVTNDYHPRLRHWTVTAHFRLFPYRDAEFAYQCLCYPHGPGHGAIAYLVPDNIEKHVENGALRSVEITYRLPPALERQANARTQLLFLTRFGFERGGGDNRVLPHSPDGEPRYLGARTVAMAPARSWFDYAPRTGTQAQLQNPDYWS